LNESQWILFFLGSTIDENSQTHKKIIKNLNNKIIIKLKKREKLLASYAISLSHSLLKPA
jgi:hypothetical protein